MFKWKVKHLQYICPWLSFLHLKCCVLPSVEGKWRRACQMTFENHQRLLAWHFGQCRSMHVHEIIFIIKLSNLQNLSAFHFYIYFLLSVGWESNDTVWCPCVIVRFKNTYLMYFLTIKMCYHLSFLHLTVNINMNSLPHFTKSYIQSV